MRFRVREASVRVVWVAGEVIGDLRRGLAGWGSWVGGVVRGVTDWRVISSFWKRGSICVMSVSN